LRNLANMRQSRGVQLGCGFWADAGQPFVDERG
jgi:hypothetical protein